jgi:hypothetical protein
MDTMRDFEPFRLELDKLCATFDRPPAKDELVEAYWASLRDVRFTEVQRNVARILRTATKETKWPKPGDLRDAAPEEGSRRSASHEAACQAAEQRNIRHWEELRATDPELHQIELSIAQCGRILASDDPSTPQYAEAIQLDRRYRDRRHALWVARVERAEGNAGR